MTWLQLSNFGGLPLTGTYLLGLISWDRLMVGSNPEATFRASILWLIYGNHEAAVKGLQIGVLSASKKGGEGFVIGMGMDERSW